MKRHYLVGGIVLLVALMGWFVGGGADAPSSPGSGQGTMLASPSTQGASNEARIATQPTLSAVLGALPAPNTLPAWVSLAQTRAEGDSRTPPLYRPGAPAAGASSAQLADPAAYRDYERGQHERTLAAFATAAQTETGVLRADVVRARAAGIAPAEIDKVERKIQRLDQLRSEIAAQGIVP